MTNPDITPVDNLSTGFAAAVLLFCQPSGSKEFYATDLMELLSLPLTG